MPPPLPFLLESLKHVETFSIRYRPVGARRLRREAILPDQHARRLAMCDSIPAALPPTGQLTPFMRRPAILYVSYDGMLEPLGQSQVLAYLERLTARYEVNLLSFEKSDDTARPERLAAVRRRIEAAGIRWTWRRYHKAPTALATAWDVSMG